MSSGPGKAQVLRTGYRGHLVQLANQLIVTAKDRPCLMDAFNAHERWQSFIKHELQQANEVGAQPESLQAPPCVDARQLRAGCRSADSCGSQRRQLL